MGTGLENSFSADPSPSIGPELRLLLLSVRSQLFRRPDPALAPLLAGVQDWTKFTGAAQAAKLGVLALRGLALNGVDLPVQPGEQLARYRDRTIMVNTANLITLRSLADPLRSSDIEIAVFKGPLHQRMIFNDYFIQPSGDIDLLVSPASYDKAALLLTKLDYVLAENCDSAWWRRTLGEQHFQTARPGHVTVDLHHRVQQPGCPSPRDLDRFIEGREAVELGTFELDGLSENYAWLLACISLVKALVHRAPAAGYACQIAAHLIKVGGSVDELLGEAAVQGLRNTALLGLRSAVVLFAAPVHGELPSTARSWMSDEDLVRMLLQPFAEGFDWPKRRSLLWTLCDDKTDFLKESFRTLAGEFSRRKHEPHA